MYLRAYMRACVHACVHAYVRACVRAFMYTLGCELVVTTTFYYNCEKVIHNVAHNVPQSLHFYVVTTLVHIAQTSLSAQT